jgi:uncharacterized repeat protein (TIGR03803 family)
MKFGQLVSRTTRNAFAAIIALGLLPIASAGPKYKVLHRFYAGQNNNGGVWGGLTFDSKGNLYGTTWGGGANGYGTVFELMPSSNGKWREKVLHSFDRRTDGGSPLGTLLLDGDATLYGTTSSANGTVFKMTRTSSGWTFSVIDDYGSHAGVVMDQGGNLYGNIGPGEYDEGAVTELVHGSEGWTQSYLYSFCRNINPCLDGDAPVSGVIFDAEGNLYGTTEYGGTGQGGDYGTAYELRHGADGTWRHLILHSFPAFQGDGLELYAGLVLDKSGNLYGSTFRGGGSIDCGTVFKLTRGAKGWKESLLHGFTRPMDGCAPGGVTFDQTGNLYGTTVSGGIGDCSGGCGVVFKLAPSSAGKWKYSVLHRFNVYDGAVPDAGVILDKKGNLFGATGLGGGGDSVGVVFEITP